MEKQKLFFVVTEDWYFYSHRRPMIKAAQDCGFAVSVITNVGDCRAVIEALGVEVIPFSFERRSLNVWQAMCQIFRLAGIYRREQPRIVHHIAMKPVLLGAVAAWAAGVPCVINAFAGLGYVFNDRGLLARALRMVLTPVFFVLLRRKNSFLLLQNKDDFSVLKKCGLAAEGRARVIRGSGVDPAAYPATPMPLPAPDFICVYAGRMIGIKGLDTLRDAFSVLGKTAPHIKLYLYGKPDPANPGSWRIEDIERWVSESDNVSYRGHSGDMAAVWAGAHLAVQASHGGEGIPKSLLEAASCGRAIVATDVPGCREVVEPGKNGVLVPPRDAVALARAIETLAADPGLCRRMGEESRRVVEDDMSSDSIRAQTAEFYRRCLTGKL